MAGLVNSLWAFLAAAVLIAAVAPPCEATISCSSVASYMTPCLPYLIGKGPLGGCCGGVKSLYSAANTTPNRQSVCGCLKSLYSQYSDVSLGNAAALPGNCGVSLPYRISPSTDCSKVE